MKARNKRVVISISVPTWLAEKIREVAARHNVTISTFAKECMIESFLNSYYKEVKNGREKEGTTHDQY